MRREITVHHDSDIQVQTVCPICDNAIFIYDDIVILKDDDGTVALAHEDCVNEDSDDEDYED